MMETFKVPALDEAGNETSVTFALKVGKVTIPSEYFENAMNAGVFIKLEGNLFFKFHYSRNDGKGTLMPSLDGIRYDALAQISAFSQP